MIPRPYQLDMIEGVRAAYRDGARSVCLQAATGSGKTATASYFLREVVVARGFRAVFLAHLDTLLEDTHEKVTAGGVEAGFVQAGKPTSPGALVQVCSTQTLHARGELPAADVVVLDECQRAEGATVRAILERYPRARILGLTAYPQRGDGKPLGAQFERLVCGPSIKWLEAQGFLVPCDVFAPDQFTGGPLAIDPVKAYTAHAAHTRAIVFAANKKHALDLTARFLLAGYSTELVLGVTHPLIRRRVRERLHSGELEVLVSVGVFIEGWDAPSVETVVHARPFGVTGGWLQSIGRGRRPSPATEKRRCTVIDCTGSVYLHGMPDEDRVWDLSDEGNGKSTEVQTQLRRCKECLAIYRPAVVCPRCGARGEASTRIPRTLTRAERLENLSRLAPEDQDRRFLEQLQRAAHKRGEPDQRANAWALKKFRERFGRDPKVRATT